MNKSTTLRPLTGRIACTVLALVLAATCTVLARSAPAPQEALAKGEEGDWSMVIRATDSTEIHYQADNGQTAYCYRFHTHGPDTGGETYTHIQRAKPAADYVYAKGYPNHTTINGKTYSASDAWRVTVYATWAVAEYTDGYGVTWDRAYNNGYRNLVEDAKAFAEVAKAYKGGDADIDGIASIVYVDGKSEVQPMLIGNQFGHLLIQKESTDPSVLETDPSDYSLAGAEFGIFEDKACTTSYRNYKLVTGDDGVAYDPDMDIVPDIYYVKELKAPKGFEIDPDVHMVKVTSAQGADMASAKYRTVLKVKETPRRSKVKLKKTSSDPQLVKGNPNYSLADAKYELYASKEDAVERKDKIATLTTGDDGSTQETKYLPLGTYYLVETKASKGCAVDPAMDYRKGKAKKVTLAQGDSVKEVTSSEPPKHATIGTVLTKKYKAASQRDDLYQYPLAGAKYLLEYYATAAERKGASPLRSWLLETDASGKVVLDEAHKAGGNDFYKSAAGDIVLPIGAYRIRETEAPAGYLLPSADDDPQTVEEFEFDVADDEEPSTTKIAVFENRGSEGIVALESSWTGGLCIGKGDAARYDDAKTGSDGTFFNYAQGDASFAGAQFALKNRSGHAVWVDGNSDNSVQDDEVFADGSTICTLTAALDATAGAYLARTPAHYLPCGTYEVEEVKAPEGYRVAGTVRKSVTISQDGQYEELVRGDGILDEVVMGGVRALKHDAELGRSEAIGAASHTASAAGATLEGVEFTVWNASKHGVLVEGEWRKPGSVALKLATAWDSELGAYAAQSSATSLPYGTYEIAETASSTGYLLTDGKRRAFEVRADGVVVTADTGGKELVWHDKVKRNDMSFKKKGAGTIALAKVPFKVTNVTSGESHVIVTDANGYADTATSWAPHATRTNANDKLVSPEYYVACGGTVQTADIEECGIWFGLGEDGSVADPDNNSGALPYGTYRIEELRCETNEGYQLWSGSFSVSKDTSQVAKAIDLGTVDDKAAPRIATCATDESDGDHFFEAEGAVTLVDEVAYENLEMGTKYVLEAMLMDKEGACAFTDPDGEPVTGHTTFTAKQPNSSARVKIEIGDASLAAGKELVVFEYLYEDGHDKPAATHEDLEDADQTVSAALGIRTELVDGADGDHHAWGESALLVDKVAYSGLVAGKAYRLAGKLMCKSSGEPLAAQEGTTPVNGVEFVPESPNGTVELSFAVSPDALRGESLVAFEELHDESGEVVAAHEDLGDEGQTVHIANGATSASDQEDGDKHLPANGTARIVDHVKYANLIAGAEYEVTGTLMDKASNAPVEGPDGSYVQARSTFTPEVADGVAEVVFSFDAELVAGKELIAFERVTSDGKEVFVHADIDDEAQTVRAPSVATTLTDSADSDHFAFGQPTALVDVAELHGLETGAEYRVTGTLVKKSTGKPVKDEQKNTVTASKTFTATAAEHRIELEFPIDPSRLSGDSVVAFEKLYVHGRQDAIAEHADIDDEGQTVHIASGATTATDAKDDDKTVTCDAEATVRDTIAYSNLLAGLEYAAEGTLMDKESGQPLRDAHGNPVTASARFTPDEPDGETSVTFAFDATALASKNLVAFERVSCDGKLVFAHEDLDDTAQTVGVEAPKQVTPQEKPEELEGTEESTQSKGETPSTTKRETVKSTEKIVDKTHDVVKPVDDAVDEEDTGSDTPASGRYAKTGSNLWALVAMTALLLAGTVVSLGYGFYRRKRT